MMPNNYNKEINLALYFINLNLNQKIIIQSLYTNN